MEEKSVSFAQLTQTYSEILAAETRSNLSLEGKKKKEKLFINKMDGRKKWKVFHNEVCRKS
jgi:hypothetical protein